MEVINTSSYEALRSNTSYQLSTASMSIKYIKSNLPEGATTLMRPTSGESALREIESHLLLEFVQTVKQDLSNYDADGMRRWRMRVHCVMRSAE